MQRRHFLAASLAASAPLGFGHAHAQGGKAQVLRLMTHESFDLPADLLAGFEKEAGVTLQIIKGGDAGEMLNKLILTKARPIADVVFGVDNTLLPRALAAEVLEPYHGPAALRSAQAAMAERAPVSGAVAGVVPVNFGFVNLNLDRTWLATRGLAAPTSLQALTESAYRNLLVVPNPQTSSAGLAFLLATLGGLGEEAAFDWWADLRRNGVKVVKGWSEAYYTEFTRHGGTRPFVVSYATSPAAEVFYAKPPVSESPTANLFLKGGVFRQVEGVALVRGAPAPSREAGGRFIEFMRGPKVQRALQTTMWMYPAEAGVALEPAMRHAIPPTHFDPLPEGASPQAIARWQQRWTRVVLK